MFGAAEVAEEHRFRYFQHITAAQKGSCFLVDYLLGEPLLVVEIQSAHQSVLTWRVTQQGAQGVYPAVEIIEVLWLDE